MILQVHISEQATVKDHCKIFALSDKEDCFKSTCTHVHDNMCQNCEQISEILTSIQQLVQKGNSVNKDINVYKIDQAVLNITAWKQHIIRARNQDGAKSILMDTMSSAEVLLVVDWAMKYLPRRFREDQSNWFAKRGINWHMGVVFHRTDSRLESLGYAHIFKKQISQDSTTTSSVILDIINDIKIKNPNINKIHIWSDNAGCYKSNDTINILFHSGLVHSMNFCEAQDGKGACDRTAATLKSGIRRYVNQGYDVVSAVQMKKVSYSK